PTCTARVPTTRWSRCPSATSSRRTAAARPSSATRSRIPRAISSRAFPVANRVLLVRLGALGDVVHAIPAAAALRRAFPSARIDWLVEAKHREIVDLVTVIDRVVTIERATVGGWTEALRAVRAVRYDVALDMQGLLKSAVLARGSGAARVVGFSIWHLREKTARPFYSSAEAADAP